MNETSSYGWRAPVQLPPLTLRQERKYSRLRYWRTRQLRAQQVVDNRPADEKLGASLRRNKTNKRWARLHWVKRSPPQHRNVVICCI